MRIGKLKSRITFQSLTKVQDDAGGFSETWNDVLTTWANLQASKGKRLLDSGKMLIWQGYTIRLRYREDVPIHEQLRILYRGKVLVIQSLLVVNETEREFEIIATTHE